MSKKKTRSHSRDVWLACLALFLTVSHEIPSRVGGVPTPQRRPRLSGPPPPPPYLPFTAEDLRFRFWYPTVGWDVVPASGKKLVEVTNRVGAHFTVLRSILELPLNLEELGNEFIDVESDVLKKDFPSAQIHSSKFVLFHKSRAMEIQYEYVSNFGPQVAREMVLIRGRDLLRLRTTSLQSTAAKTEPLLAWMLDNFYFYETLASAPTIPRPMSADVVASLAPTAPAQTVAPKPAAPVSTPSSLHNAQALYQQARTEYLKFTLSSAQKAMDLFQQSRAADRSFALAYAGQAEALGWRILLLRTRAIKSENVNPHAVLDLAQQAAKLNRDHVAIQRALAWGFALNEEGKETENALKRAEKLDSSDAETHLVAAAWHGDSPEEALEDTQQALDTNASLVGALYLQGLAYLKLERLQEAFASFNKAARLSPDFAEAHFQKAQLYVRAAQNEEAVASYQKAISADPQFVDAHFRLAVFQQQLKRVDDAIQAYQAALQAYPTLPQAYYNLGALFAGEKNDNAQAAVYFKKFLQYTQDEVKAEQIRQWLQANVK